MYKIITFYKFVPLPQFRDWQAPIRNFCERHGIKGTILLAGEGINSTIAGLPDDIEKTIGFLRNFPKLADLTYKESAATAMPFGKLKVQVKKEIVTFKQPVDPTDRVGHYVPAQEWNDLIARDDVILVDTRNHYEVEMGTFDKALDPGTTHFSEFPDYVKTQLADKKDQPIAMFCTGGIRCEKATSYLLQQGFKHVFHLQGGILKYLEEIAPEQSKWKGECFVFDEREALAHGLKPKK